eukprot:9232689-Pyramimonas_sp.AAC.1
MGGRPSLIGSASESSPEGAAPTFGVLSERPDLLVVSQGLGHARELGGPSREPLRGPVSARSRPDVEHPLHPVVQTSAICRSNPTRSKRNHQN